MNMIQVNGDSAVKVIFQDEISLKLTMKIQKLIKLIRKSTVKGIMEMVPAYNSLTIYYDPFIYSHQAICKQLQYLFLLLQVDVYQIKARLVHVPVLYDGEDLKHVADYHGITTNDVIAIHQKATYFICMLGFLPGFPYLGGMDPRIATPRRKNPRERVGKGSVGIAHEQTGIYPRSSPGGWNIIGKTPLTLFNRENEQPCLFQPGDLVVFESISATKYMQIEQEINQGTFCVQIEQEYSC